MSPARRAAALLLVLSLGAVLRLSGLRWDEGQALHPDERFLAMATGSLSTPKSLPLYLDEARSTLNPRNSGFKFFAYGTLPTTAVRLLAEPVSRTGFSDLLLLGRLVSALASTATVFLVFLLARALLEDPRVALLAAFFQASAVLPIQHSHFFVVDEVMTLLTTASLLFLARWRRNEKTREMAAAGLLLGAALACKISAALLVAPFAAVALASVLASPREDAASRAASSVRQRLARTTLALAVAGVLALAAFRLLDPPTFSGFLTPSSRWLANLAEARSLVSGEADVPPGIQWAGRTRWLFPLRNLILFGLGPALGFTSFLCAGVATCSVARRRGDRLILPLVAAGVFVVQQGGQFVSSMRYLLPVYPYLGFLAAWGLVAFFDRAREREAAGRPFARMARLASVTALVGVPLLTLLWALAFTGVYRRPHTRILASRWIYANVLPGSAIGCEHWDDALPLRLDGRDAYGGLYRGISMDWYDPDTPAKLEAAVRWLDSADVVVLSSDRLSASIPRLPLRWPLTNRYYELLERERLGFARAATFSSRPALLGIEIHDESAEEAFTVYDHPRVRIYRKTPSYSSERVRALLGSVLLDDVLGLSPLQAKRYPNGLRLPARLKEDQRRAGSWPEIFPDRGPGALAPVLVWTGALFLLSFAGAPLLRATCPSLPDGGYALGRVAGLLSVGWLAWLLASLGLVPHTRGGIALAFLVVLCISGAVTFAGRQSGHDRFRPGTGRLILIEEGLFWSAFAAFLLIRWANPDLWHPSLMGEKPMDLAFLSAVVKSDRFPPYDPWFAGGTMNYYYFGFVLVGQLVKLTGVVPEVAANLAVATLFALVVSASFGVTLALVTPPGETPRRLSVLTAAAGALFVAVLGNLGQLRVFLDRLAELSPIPAGARLLPRALAGLAQWWATGGPLPGRVEWPYWTPTRLVSHPPGEAGPINEFPFFSYLFGDLHAHTMALPLALLAAGLALALVRERVAGGLIGRARNVPIFGFLALALGSLATTNAWDFLAWGLAVGALLSAGCAFSTTRRWRGVLSGAVLAAGAGLLGLLLFLPFHRAYGTPYGRFRPWDGSRTSPFDYFLAHGLFVAVISVLILVELSGSRAAAPVRFVCGALHVGKRGSRFRRRFGRWVAPSRELRFSLDVVALVLAAAVIAAMYGAVLAGILVILLTGIGLALSGRRTDPLRVSLLVVAGVGLLLTLIPEVLVLDGDVARMNTVFKFWFAAWSLLAIASAAALPRLWAGRHLLGRRGWRLAALIFAVFGALSASCTVLALKARIADRAVDGAPRTLDGLRSIERAATTIGDVKLPLAPDLLAIAWLRRNVSGSPVVLEANTFPQLYGWGGRVAAFTGLPTVIGWEWHERQQRGAVEGEGIARRIADVERLYRTKDAGELARLLARYGISYVVVGGLERTLYGTGGLATRGNGVPGLLEPAFAANGVEIYRVPGG